MSCPLTFCYSCISIMVACERVPKDNGFPSQTCSFRKGVARADAADAQRKKRFVLEKSMAKFEIRNFDHVTLTRKWCRLVRRAAFVFAVRFHVTSTQQRWTSISTHAQGPGASSTVLLVPRRRQDMSPLQHTNIISAN